MTYLALLSPTIHHSTLPAILIGAVLGIALVGLFGWGVAALLGRRFVIRLGLVLFAGLFGLLGAVIGDIKAAKKRKMTEREVSVAQRVFGNTIDYSKVRLVEHCRLMNAPRRRMARTPFNTIYLGKRYSKPLNEKEFSYYEDFLIHEMTHVWQTQHGVPFRKKLGTALRVVFNRKKPYDYGRSVGLHRAWRNEKSFRDFNTEQQGRILEDYHCCCHHSWITGQDPDCVFHEYFARQVQLNNGYRMPNDSIEGVTLPTLRIRKKE